MQLNVKRILQSLPVLNDAYTTFKWRERKVSYGKENADKIFYVVRRATCKVGLFSYVMTNLGLIKYALEKGYIPVIDMKSMRNTYLEDEQVGKTNAWEFYFKQPCGYSLEDINRSKNIILSSGLITEKNMYPDQSMLLDLYKTNYWREIVSRYLKVNEIIQIEVDNIYQELFGTKKVLGVLARGTDYIHNRPFNHPIQPTVEELQEKIDEVIYVYQCKYIYLATEDDAIFHKLKEIYGNQLIATDAKRCMTKENQNINDITYERMNDKYLRGKEYLINILLLAKCNCLLAGNVNGSMAASLLTKGYEYQYIFDKGVYS